MHDLRALGRKQMMQLPHTLPIESRAAPQIHNVNSILNKHFTELTDFIQAGNDETVSVAKATDDAIDQYLRPSDWQPMNKLANRRSAGGRTVPV
jgi:hypothetical protein